MPEMREVYSTGGMQHVQPEKTIDLELSQPLAQVEGLHGYGALHGLVRLHGDPLGYVRVPLHEGRCTGEQLVGAVLSERPGAG
jgi:hypothetical protein